MLWVHEGVGAGVSSCVEEWQRKSVNVDYSWETGRIQGLAGQTLLTHWDQRWDCFHWKEFQEWARRAISDFTQRTLTTVLIHGQAHTRSHTHLKILYLTPTMVCETHSVPSCQWVRSDSRWILILPSVKWKLSPLTFLTSRVVNEQIDSLNN